MKTKKLSDLLTGEEFENLRGFALLFDKDSEFFEFSGFVTAALLDYEQENDQSITILGIITEKHGWITFRRTREDLEKMFKNCQFIGQDEESSFVLEK